MELSADVNLFDLPPQLLADHCQHLQIMAQDCARCAGVATQDREDCASEFVLRILSLHRQQQGGDSRNFSMAWLHRCAVNHAIDFKRRQGRLSHRESEIVSEDVDEEDYAHDAPGPEAQMLTQEFFGLLLREAHILTLAQQDLFARLIVNDDTAAEAGLATGRTAQAIRQSQSNLRRQMRLLLERRGISEAHLREYILPTEQRRGGGDKTSAACFLICLSRKSEGRPQKSPLTFCTRNSLIIVGAMLLRQSYNHFAGNNNGAANDLDGLYMQ